MFVAIHMDWHGASGGGGTHAIDSISYERARIHDGLGVKKH